MSTCPEKDIHSIYLDNELPASYVAEYEAHVKLCPRCQAELNKLKSLHQSFSSDCKNMTLTAEAKEASFERLQARLSYSKVTGRNIHAFNSFKNSSSYKTIIGFAAAAAIIAVILPVRTTNKDSQNQNQFQPVARTTLVSPAKANVKVDGAINTKKLASIFNNSNTDTNLSSSNVSPLLATSVSTVSNSNSGIMYGIPVFNSSSQDAEGLRSTLTSYDVFCPISYDSNSNSTSSNNQGITIRFNSEFGQFYLQIGNVK